MREGAKTSQDLRTETAVSQLRHGNVSWKVELMTGILVNLLRSGKLLGENDQSVPWHWHVPSLPCTSRMRLGSMRSWGLNQHPNWGMVLLLKLSMVIIILQSIFLWMIPMVHAAATIQLFSASRGTRSPDNAALRLATSVKTPWETERSTENCPNPNQQAYSEFLLSRCRQWNG